MGVKELNQFLSTETRRKVFLYYVFDNIAPSDIVDETDIPFSTVDRITQLLKAHEILIESEGRDKREKRYKVDFDRWVKENLEYMGLGFLDDYETKEISDLFKDENFFILSYLSNHADFIMDFFQEPLKIDEKIPFLILMEMDHVNNKPAQLPSYILVHLKFSPLVEKLAEDIDKGVLDIDIREINKGIKRYTHLKEKTIDEDILKEFEKKRSHLTFLLKRVFEKKILKMSVKKEKEIHE